MSRKASRKPAYQTRIAKERIEILFSQAGKEFRKHPERSDRYVQLARKIAMRYNVGVPGELKKRFCRKCQSYLVPGANCKVRTAKKTLSVMCLKCGTTTRHPIGPKNI